ncbi:Fe-S cluster assembly protein IscX [Candidatus Vallotiella sp. (ex Adelges kitamiensis)]|uniref:Fe-S cluster assembly protein IscX n=1 Tax=Candidatus Vallotiella sp. (ex Adelges kitamiensis) TaxID=2864217 RepID=UPI001CE2CA5D|nr:Fe-S cluster assembly protein IscX [Candidatus Vallotia sp. (ex Adelges kitamiensis)]
MKWTDINDIAVALINSYPDINPQYIRFTDLYQWVIKLDGFDDKPKFSGEKILEAIQLAWIRDAD